MLEVPCVNTEFGKTTLGFEYINYSITVFVNCVLLFVSFCFLISYFWCVIILFLIVLATFKMRAGPQ